MPALGRAAETEAGGVFAAGLQDSRTMDQLARARNREHMNIPDEPEPISELSMEQRVYIYNVSPFHFQQELASYGSKMIAALPEESVFGKDENGEFLVAGPLVIDGLPKEYYPADGEAKVIYHRPTKNRGRQSKRPGLDFANEVIGKGMMVNPSCNLELFGVFISEQPQQFRPDKPEKPDKDYRDALKHYEKWNADVMAAHNMLRKKCVKMCQDANIEYMRGKFGEIRNDQLYLAARLIKGTVVEYKWLGDVEDTAQNQACPGCGKTVKIGILKCGDCGYRLCTDEEWDRVKNRYA